MPFIKIKCKAEVLLVALTCVLYISCAVLPSSLTSSRFVNPKINPTLVPANLNFRPINSWDYTIDIFFTGAVSCFDLRNVHSMCSCAHSLSHICRDRLREWRGVREEKF